MKLGLTGLYFLRKARGGRVNTFSEYENQETTRKRVGTLMATLVTPPVFIAILVLRQSGEFASLFDPSADWGDWSIRAFGLLWILGLIPLAYFVFGWFSVGVRKKFREMILQARLNNEDIAWRGIARFPVIRSWLFPGLV